MERAVGFLVGLGFPMIWTCGDIISHAMQGIPWVNSINPGAYAGMLAVSGIFGMFLGGAFQRVRQGALTDPLTMIGNRRAFMKEAESMLSSSIQRKHRLTVAVLDLDGFKAYNDSMGHLEGDALLRVVASRLKRQLRTSDVLCRFGGDEFTILFPHTGIEAAKGILSRASAALFDIGVTFSVGMAECPRNAKELDTLLRIADKELYKEKKRNKEAASRILAVN